MKTKLEQFFIDGIKQHIERYKKQSNNTSLPPFEREAYAISMYNSMELLTDSAKIEQNAD